MKSVSIVHIAGIVVRGVSGFSKLLALHSFSKSLGEWYIVPDGTEPFVALLIATVEYAFACAAIVGLGRKYALIIAAAIFSVLFAGSSLERLLAGPPDCNCLGIIAQYMEARARQTLSSIVSGSLAIASVLTVIRMRRYV